MNFFEELNKKLYDSDLLPVDLKESVKKSKKIHPNRYKGLAEFFENNNFKKGLEIGRSFGYSAVAFTTFYPDATLDSIDIIERPENKMLFDYMKVSDRINILVGNSELIPKNEIYDYILIDGDHSYKGAKLDWDRIQSHVKSGTIVIIDDIHHVWGPKVKSVAHLWKEIENTHNARKICRDLGIVEM